MRLLSAATPAKPPGGGGGGKGMCPGTPWASFLGASGMSTDLCTSSTVSHFLRLPLWVVQKMKKNRESDFVQFGKILQDNESNKYLG